jgi:hypothetical protein
MSVDISHISPRVETVPSDVKKYDPEDWQFSPFEFASLNQDYGPVTLEACVDDNGCNALTDKYVTKSQDFLQSDCQGETVWINPPFQKAEHFLRHYLQCKAKNPIDTCALIVLPYWPRKSWWNLTKGFLQVRR